MCKATRLAGIVMERSLDWAAGVRLAEVKFTTLGGEGGKMVDTKQG